jgi:hypothetical protein
MGRGVASFRRALSSELRHKRKLALRLGHVTKESDWHLSPRLTRQVLKIGKWVEHIEAALLQGPSVRLSALGEAGKRELQEFIAARREVSERDVNFGLRQKGVDMRIGLDIASVTLKHQVAELDFPRLAVTALAIGEDLDALSRGLKVNAATLSSPGRRCETHWPKSG